MTTKNLNEEKIDTVSKAFEEKLNIYVQEVSLAIDCFYSYLTIHNMMLENKKLHKELNKNSLFWNTVLPSLQTTFFITLGRIFDKNEKSHSISHLLKYSKEHKEIFSYKQFVKMKKRDVPTIDLKEYMKDKDVEFFTDDDFSIFDRQVDSCKEIYDKNYKKLRNKIYGHRDLNSIGKEDKIFSKTSIGELKYILDFLDRVYIALWELYHNGIKLDVNRIESRDHQDEIINYTKNLLNSLDTRS